MAEATTQLVETLLVERKLTLSHGGLNKGLARHGNPVPGVRMMSRNSLPGYGPAPDSGPSRAEQTPPSRSGRTRENARLVRHRV